ncbi:MAG: HNH endonuclease [Weeksellaceae bacterium]|jgi:hypothetical protein
MKSLLPKEDLELHKAFEIILSIETFSDYILDISELIYKNELDNEQINKVLKYHNIKKIEDIKDELLDLLIVYINLILNDHIITENEKNNVRLLKMYFRIKEGDFINKRSNEVEDILQRQFERLYSDNLINTSESLLLVDLQGVFDLSYDQFDKLKEIEVRKALERGADISELDTARIPKVINVQNETLGRQISQQVKDLVWNRDNGQCRECGSNEQLEFDHIIPFSKGGSNTYRNIQLLCEPCNRKKSNKIG